MNGNPLLWEVKFLKGVGDFRAKLLEKLNIFTIGDVMETFPVNYINRKSTVRIADMEYDRVCSVIGQISSLEARPIQGNRTQVNVLISDGDDYLLCTWFTHGKWLIEDMQIGRRIWVSGKLSTYGGYQQIIHPEYEILKDDDTIHDFWKNRDVLPVYRLTDKLTINAMRNIVYHAFSTYASFIRENLPANLVCKYGFPPRNTALQNLHFPVESTDLDLARRRFIYEELFFNQMMLARCRGFHEKALKAVPITVRKTHTTCLKNSLPFRLTNAQKRVIREIVADMEAPGRMHRLLQGDVGSGKTIVTLFAMLLAVENGCQALLMAPTELLAEQHYRSFQRFLGNQPELKTMLLLGGQYKGKKQDLEAIARGEVQLIVGTHALIQKGVVFHRVGLVVIDEQHRFGVKQRSLASTQEGNPDVLHLTATPIPRSLALTLYGDLDISVLDEMPPNRQPVQTDWKTEAKRPSVYNEIRKELVRGRQAYIVCPLIQESEKSDLLAVEVLYKHLVEHVFPDIPCSMLHGRMKPAEKDEIMKRFVAGEIGILVSTTVIEVGIDVPNATMMMIEHAERFGLSQLHQLRGRIGRGSEKSTCWLIAYSPLSQDARKRLEIMTMTHDGFLVAEKDLEIRGPGEFFGTLQSGAPAFRHANIVRDQQMLLAARADVTEILKADPDLASPDLADTLACYNEIYSEREALFRY